MKFLSSHKTTILTFIIITLCITTTIVSCARYTQAVSIRFYGSDTSETADTVEDCAQMALEATAEGFGYCESNSTCMLFTDIYGYATGNDACYFYIRKDDQPDECASTSDMTSALHDLVYDNGDCPTGFTYNSTAQFCYSNMTQDECSMYSATWRYPYMPVSQTPCALYGSSQTEFLDDYACENYGSKLQIFQGSAYCYVRVAVTTALAENASVVTANGCSWLYDVNSNTIKVGSQLEIDFIHVSYGTVMIGGYSAGYTLGSITINEASDYKFYDNSSASAYLDQSTISSSTPGFMYTTGSELTLP
ncbi:unnamed protein product [Bursaphelenchus okinawaensis]|uniref:Uncharacterized protein n=1 Tax=Bursaphelenchus okinawaensis TaxID=465554 RepID=A0A811JQV6_9BILA|nr:unnamed protein product [Bursaphelenchus okinawaensis]CAG9079203.1 unnamed protein product [Bursaphelenchus okinawaensis]